MVSENGAWDTHACEHQNQEGSLYLMAQRFHMSLRLAFLAVSMVALSLALLRLNITVVHSVILAVFGVILLGASIGWPIGYVLRGPRGAVVGGGCGVLLLFSALYVLVVVLDALG